MDNNNYNNYNGNNYSNNSNYNNQQYDPSYNAGGYQNTDQYGNTGYAQQQRYMSEEDRKSMTARAMTGTMAMMFLGLLLTAAVSIFTLYSRTLLEFVYYTPYGFYVCIIAELGIVVLLSARLHKMKSGTAIAMFFLYAAVNGITLSSIFFAYTGYSIIIAFGVAAFMFGTMALFGAVTKSNLASLGGILFMGLIGVIIASVINMFFFSYFLDGIICYVGVALFLGLTAYDMQKIKTMVAQSNSAEDTRKIAVFGALNLYLDMINIFLYVLRILNRRK